MSLDSIQAQDEIKHTELLKSQPKTTLNSQNCLILNSIYLVYFHFSLAR